MSLRKRIDHGKKLIRLTIRELGANFMALNLYPLGLFSGNEKGYPHPRRAYNQRPVLLVHGIVHNPSAFYKLKKKMDEEGWQNVYTINYSTSHGSLTKMVEILAKKVDLILEQTKSGQIDIVAHSMGGIISRYFMTIGVGRGKVRNLVTLGTPHQGTEMSVFLRGMSRGSLNSDLRAGSYFVKSLQGHALPRGSKITSVYTPYDILVWPRKNCIAQGAPKMSFENVEFRHVGHMGLLYNDQVLDTVMRRLARVASQEK